MRVDETEGLKGWLIGLAASFALIELIVGYFLLNSEVLKNPGIQSIIEVLKFFATTFGGVAILINVYYAAKRAKAMDDSAIAANKSAEAALDNAKAALKNAKAAQDKQITERFTKAIELLDSANISICLGGIYALERIAKNSKKDHWTIMEVLTAFIRENTSFKEEEIQQEQLPEISTNIQAALTVIGRRDVKRNPNNQRLDLHNTNLKRANLIKANLQGANLIKANLQGAYLIEASLQEAFLNAANLQEAFLSEANLQGTNLGHTNLQKAFLNAANLQGADLKNANLKGANLSEAKNLEFEQIETAFGDSATVLPDNVERPAHWT